jgi:hypothetical protein
LIKNNSKLLSESPPSNQSPVTYSNIYLRVQPFTTSVTIPEQPAFSESSTGIPASTQTDLQFILLLIDPDHQLVHTTISQSVPGKWLEIWDQYDWVEDLVAETLRLGVEVVGQEYVVARMGWGSADTTVRKEVKDEDDGVVVVDEKAA